MVTWPCVLRAEPMPCQRCGFLGPQCDQKSWRSRMRKPLIAFSLAVVASLGVGTTASLAAPATVPTTNSPSNNSPSTTSLDAQTESSQANLPAVSGAQIVATAMKYLGYPYTATGNSPSTGFSCIGFASYVYHVNGIPLPGFLQGAYDYAPHVSYSQLEPGDLVFFQNTVWPGISHVAIYIGGGKVIHAAWYNTGVEISSITGDPKDGSYWIQHYLGANRPWTGSAVGTVESPTTGNPTVGSGNNATSPTVTTATGPTATVSVASLNVRSGPSTRDSVIAVIVQGTVVNVIGHRHGWYRVRLPSGAVGWVVAMGIGKGSPATTVSNPTAPTKAGTPTAASTGPTATSSVAGLRVHSSPSLGASVVTSLGKGQKVTVIKRSGNWVEVRLANGKVGWVDAAYLQIGATTTATKTTDTSTTITTNRNAKIATVAFNVRAARSIRSRVVAVVPVGGSYSILYWRGGWARVRDR